MCQSGLFGDMQVLGMMGLTPVVQCRMVVIAEELMNLAVRYGWKT